MKANQTLAPIATSIVLSIFATSAAEAGLIRGGGRGGAVAPAFGGSDTYLLPVGIYDEIGDVVPASVLVSPAVLPSYSYTSGTGDPLQAHHNWGAACAERRQIPGAPLGENYDCLFQLGADEVFNWSGHIIGLPLSTEIDDGAPKPELRYTWSLNAGTEVFTFDQDSPNAPLGAETTRPSADPDGFDETCFASFLSYDAGGCQILELNSGLTGSQLLDAAMGGDISLALSVELLAPDGFEFVTIWGYDDPDPLIRGEVASEPPVTSLRAQSQALRIEVETADVPAPTPIVLILSSFALLRLRSLKRRWKAEEDIS